MKTGTPVHRDFFCGDADTRGVPSVKSFLSAIVLLATLTLTVLPPPAWAGSHKHPVKTDAPSDPDYVLALAAANHFLHACQIGDIEHGMVQLSDGVRRTQNAQTVEKFFSDAKGQAFEISRGHGQPGRYSFPVVLVGTQGSLIIRKTTEVVVMEIGKNDWVIDKLP
jgi:hypothetical protein